jgi:hypothetical protein
MKTITYFWHWLFHAKPKAPETPPKEIADKPAADEPALHQARPFADDDSPPGYKIRWHC